MGVAVTVVFTGTLALGSRPLHKEQPLEDDMESQCRGTKPRKVWAIMGSTVLRR